MVNTAFRALANLNSLIAKICIAIISLLLSVVVVVMMCSVIWRYVLNNPIPWSDDVSLISMVWMALLGLPPGMRDGHLAVEGLIAALPGFARRIVNMVVYAAVLFSAALIVYFGFKFVGQGMARIVPSIQWLKQGYIYMSVPVGFALIIPLCVERALAPFFSEATETAGV